MFRAGASATASVARGAGGHCQELHSLDAGPLSRPPGGRANSPSAVRVGRVQSHSFKWLEPLATGHAPSGRPVSLRDSVGAILHVSGLGFSVFPIVAPHSRQTPEVLRVRSYARLTHSRCRWRGSNRRVQPVRRRCGSAYHVSASCDGLLLGGLADKLVSRLAVAFGRLPTRTPSRPLSSACATNARSD